MYEHLTKEGKLKNIVPGEYIYAPYAPPEMVGRVWDLLLTYTKLYQKFCNDIFDGAILVRKRFNASDSNIYQKIRQDIFSKKGLYKKYRGYE